MYNLINCKVRTTPAEFYFDAISVYNFYDLEVSWLNLWNQVTVAVMWEMLWKCSLKILSLWLILCKNLWEMKWQWCNDVWRMLGQCFVILEMLWQCSMRHLWQCVRFYFPLGVLNDKCPYPLAIQNTIKCDWKRFY